MLKRALATCVLITTLLFTFTGCPEGVAPNIAFNGKLEDAITKQLNFLTGNITDLTSIYPTSFWEFYEKDGYLETRKEEITEYSNAMLWCLEQKYGEDITITAKFTDKEECKDSELENIATYLYQSYLIEVDTVTEAYEVELKFSLKGSLGNDSDDEKFIIAKIVGEWYVVSRTSYGEDSGYDYFLTEPGNFAMLFLESEEYHEYFEAYSEEHKDPDEGTPLGAVKLLCKYMTGDQQNIDKLYPGGYWEYYDKYDSNSSLDAARKRSDMISEAVNTKKALDNRYGRSLNITVSEKATTEVRKDSASIRQQIADNYHLNINNISDIYQIEVNVKASGTKRSETKTATFRVIKYVDVYYVLDDTSFVQADVIGKLFVK